METKKQDLRSQLKQKPGKAVMLGVLAVGALWSWTGIVLGGDDQAAAGGGAPPPAAQAAPAPVPGAPKPAAPAAALESFQAAMDRLAGWQEALRPDDLVPEGPVSVPAVLADEALDPGDGFPERPVAVEELDEIPALTGTVLFGERRFAAFGDLRVQEGGRIGRYKVAAVRSREVDLQDGDLVLTLKIRQAELTKRSDTKATDQ
ncbi:MAG: hypothetical protein H8E31_09640 [Planctomycetes bacterium]|nr:hypothetical protein [Planctomycetota bacterium]